MSRRSIVMIFVALTLLISIYFIVDHRYQDTKQLDVVDVDVPDTSQHALFSAAENGNIDDIIGLYFAGADFSARNSNGETVADIAKQRGDRHGNLVLNVLMLHYYCKSGDVVGVKALIHAGIDPNIRIKEMPEQIPIRTAIFENQKDVVALLVKSGASLHALPSLLDHHLIEPPIIIAASQGRAGIVQELLNLGAKTQEPGSNGITALHVAALRGHVSIMKLLLHSGASANAKDGSGYTPMHFAAGSYDVKPEVFKVLVNAGGSVRAKTNSGLTPIDIAKDRHIDANYLTLTKIAN